MRNKWQRVLAIVVSAALVFIAIVQGQSNQVTEVFAASHTSSGCKLVHNKVQYTSRTEEEARNNIVNAANHYNGWTLSCLKYIYPSSVTAWCAWYVNRLAEAAGVLDVFYNSNNAGDMLQVMTNSYGAKGYYTASGYNNAVNRGTTSVLGSSVSWNSGNAYTPQKGDLVFFAWYNSSKQTTQTVSHVGVVVDYKDNGNGTATFHYADGNNGTAYTRNYKARTINIGTGVIAESGWNGGIVVAFASPAYANAASVNPCASGHVYNSGSVTKAPTCVAEGLKTYTCTVCGATKTESIAKLNSHTFSSAWTRDANYHWHVCTVSGCGAVSGKTSHTAGEWIVDKEATLQSEGSRHKECTTCGYVMITETIPKLVYTTNAVITDAGLFTVENTREHIVMGIVVTASEKTDIEYRGSIRDSLGNTKVVKDWTLNNEWLNIEPDTYGEYTLIAEARVVGNPASSKTVEEVIYFNPHIKGKCQLPYGMIIPGQPGYLIGVETYENPNQEYQYEMLILDCTLLAQGKDAWVYTTNKFTVADGAAGWCVWQPQYGYYWTLFRVYDKNGKMIDQACYPFVNAY